MQSELRLSWRLSVPKGLAGILTYFQRKVNKKVGGRVWGLGVSKKIKTGSGEDS